MRSPAGLALYCSELTPSDFLTCPPRSTPNRVRTARNVHAIHGKMALPRPQHPGTRTLLISRYPENADRNFKSSARSFLFPFRTGRLRFSTVSFHFYVFKYILNFFLKTILDWGNICVPTVSFIPSFGFLGEISLNAAIVVIQTSITVLCCLPASHCSTQPQRQEFDPVRSLCWSYVERLSMLRLEAMSMWAWDFHGRPPWHMKKACLQ